MKYNVFFLLCMILLFSCRVQKPAVKDKADIIVSVGQDFMIELDANPSTGYTWQRVKTTPNSALVQQSESFVSSAKAQMVGAGGKLQIHFKAIRSGAETLRLVYVRPWEKGAPPAKTASYRVVIE